jgi:hypothetical protein
MRRYCALLFGVGVTGGAGFAGAGAGVDAGGDICAVADGFDWFIAVLVPFWPG